MSEWGNPSGSNAREPIYRWVSRGTEISKYPEEKKSIEMPLVATSESGIVQTMRLRVGL